MEPVRRGVVVTVVGRALTMAYLIDDVDLAALWRHYELAGRSCCMHSLHTWGDHLEMVKATSMAYLIDTGDGVDSSSLARICAWGRRIGYYTLPKMAI